MAAYVIIIKEEESDTSVVYKFGPDEKVMGRLAYNKVKKTFIELEPVIDDFNIPSKFYFDRAAQKLVKYIIKGEYPDRTCWAS